MISDYGLRITDYRKGLVLVLVFVLCLGLVSSAGDFLVRSEVDLSPYFIVNGDTGNVGVGTFNPSHKLEIQGDAFVNGLTVYNASNIGSFKTFAKGNPGAASGIEYNAINGYGFEIRDSYGKSRLFIDKNRNGNVGIGTNEPTEELDVNGTLRATAGVFGSLNSPSSMMAIKTSNVNRLIMGSSTSTFTTNLNVDQGLTVDQGIYAAGDICSGSTCLSNVTSGIQTPQWIRNGTDIYYEEGDVLVGQNSYFGLTDYPMGTAYNFTVGTRADNNPFRSAEIVFRQGADSSGKIAFRTYMAGGAWASDDLLIEHDKVIFENTVYAPRMVVDSLTSLDNGVLTLRSETDNYILFVDNKAAYRGSLGFLNNDPDLVYKAGGTNLNEGTEVLRVKPTGLNVNGSVFADEVCLDDGTCLSNFSGNFTPTNSEKVGGYDASYFMPLNKSVYGDFDFNGGWTNNGVSIIDGSLYAQAGYFYDVNAISVSNLDVNGSLLPETGYDNTFDVGAANRRWKDAYFGGAVLTEQMGIGTDSPSVDFEMKGENDMVLIWENETRTDNGAPTVAIVRGSSAVPFDSGALLELYNGDGVRDVINSHENFIVTPQGRVSIGGDFAFDSNTYLTVNKNIRSGSMDIVTPLNNRVALSLESGINTNQGLLELNHPWTGGFNSKGLIQINKLASSNINYLKFDDNFIVDKFGHLGVGVAVENMTDAVTVSGNVLADDLCLRDGTCVGSLVAGLWTNNSGVATYSQGEVLIDVPNTGDGGIGFDRLINGYNSINWESNQVGLGLVVGGGLAAKIHPNQYFSIGTGTSINQNNDVFTVYGNGTVQAARFVGDGSGLTGVGTGDVTGIAAGNGIFVNSADGPVPQVGIGTGGVTTTEIFDGTVQEIDLEVTNTPTDNYVLSYDSATGGFTWVADSNSGGDITGVTAGTGLTGGGTSGTVTLNVADNYVINTGDTMSGHLQFSNSGTAKRGIYGTMADNDNWFVGGAGTASNAGYLEIATGDDGQGAGEPIYVRQYGPGSPLTGTLVRTATLLDGSGNTQFPGDLIVNGGDLSVNNNNGGVNFNDVSKYWMKTATNWGVYWDTTNNRIAFHGAGTERGYIDLDDGYMQLDSTIAPANINTGIGTTEVYLMNQNVRTTDTPTFDALYIGGTADAADRVVRVTSADAYKAGFEAYGASQGTGYMYVGQSTTHGGGISYNGDGSPAFVSGESADRITFFRRNAGADSEVFSYSYASDAVSFNGDINVGGGDITSGSSLNMDAPSVVITIG